MSDTYIEWQEGKALHKKALHKHVLSFSISIQGFASLGDHPMLTKTFSTNGRTVMTPRKRFPEGVWSATPTPFTKTMKLDKISLRRLVEHHVRLGVKGLFLCGTCGEGPWMSDAMRDEVLRETVKANCGRMAISVQVTDNSAPRILENIRRTKAGGAQVAVISNPFFLIRSNEKLLANLYNEVLAKSPLPVAFYNRGKHASVPFPDRLLKKLYLHPKVVFIKDSTADPMHRKLALACKKKRPSLLLFNGNEFDCVPYIQDGYDGLMLGGGCFNGFMANQIFEAVRAGHLDQAEALQKKMSKMMTAIFGGKGFPCWLTGQKELLVQLGIFRTNLNHMEFPLYMSCEKAIARIVEKEKSVLLPERGY